ncbi:(2Fe-2S)-binding protein [Ihubacter sp. rT4E-8]|uniref:(2Fe-2S)-binding protein n=1 Tax=unclassified Ihubacter TaxID=2633299 RepID=UPI00137B9130
MDKTSRDYEVCLCYHTTRGQIEDIIRETGITTLKELCETAKVGNKCGGCREDLQMILDDVLSE